MKKLIQRIKKGKNSILMFFVLPIWVVVGFFLSTKLVLVFVYLSKLLNISLESINISVLNTIISALVYVFMGLIIFGVPALIKRSKTTINDVGLQRLPNWTEILITPAGFVIYLIISSILMLIMSSVFPWIDVNQIQDTGFSQLNQRYEYLLAFIALVVVAPVAEEIIFRGYLFGKLKKYAPVWLAVLATSLLFGAVHGAWNLAIDTFALSVILCLLRQITGSIWPSILLHMTKNGIAYFILFIYPMLFGTL